MIHCRGQHEIAIGEPSSLAQKNLALRKVDPLIADVSAMSSRLLDNDRIFRDRRKFLDHNGVTAGGHDAAGKDPRRLIWTDHSRKWMTSSNFTYHFKCHRSFCDICCADRKSIHCRNRRGGLSAESCEILNEDATKGIIEWHSFTRQWVRLGQHPLQCVRNRHEDH